jgi:hypothetical protein
MYVGFNLEINNDIISETNKNLGLSIYNDIKNRVRQQLDSYINPNGSLNGTKMREDWFPLVDADIFISHSHNDEEKAIALAGWLQNEFGLTAFIDSCVWGYAGDLLRKIDQEFCWNEQTKMYNYNTRNFTTSHVHMMLASALTLMMDKTECVFFLRTPESIKTEDVIKKTASPWIYHELTMTHLIQKKSPEQHRKYLKKGMYKYAESKKLNITYDVNLENLINLNDKDLQNWSPALMQKKLETLFKYNTDVHPLDVLYEQKEAVIQKNGGSLLNG